MAETNFNESNFTAQCAYYEGYSSGRFAVIAVAGAFSLCGIFINAFLTVVFLRIREQATSVLYLIVLALLDCGVCAGFVLLIGVDAICHYLKISFLFHLWHMYIIPVFNFTKTVQLCIPYMLILATLERNVFLSEQSGARASPMGALLSRLLTTRNRRYVAGGVCAICILLRFPDMFALEVKDYVNCTDEFRSKGAQPNEFFQTKFYSYYSLYLMTAIQVFIPFVVLTVLNVVTVRKMIMHDNAKKRSLSYSNPSMKVAARIRAGSFAVDNSTTMDDGSMLHIDHLPQAHLITPSSYSNGGQNHVHFKAGTHMPGSTPSVPKPQTAKESIASLIVPTCDSGATIATTAEPKTINNDWEGMPENYVLVAMTSRLLHEKVVSNTPAARSKKRQVRSAINTMLVIVTSYLVCNSLHILLIILERVNPPGLLYEEAYTSTAFYVTLSDLISLSYMMCSAFRAVVYYTTNLNLRRDIEAAICCRRRPAQTSTDAGGIMLNSTNARRTQQWPENV